MFFQTGGSILALWGRAELAEDSVIEDGGGFGGHRAGVQRGLTWGRWMPSSRRRVPAGAHIAREPADDVLGRLLRRASTIWTATPGRSPHNPHWTLGEDGSITLGK